jgi:hypothetical protein
LNRHFIKGFFSTRLEATPSDFKGCQNSVTLGFWIRLDMMVVKHIVF